MKELHSYVPDNLMIFEGFYESSLYNSDMEYYYNEGLDDGEPECEIDDFGEYMNDVGRMVTDVLRDYLCSDEEICDSVEFERISSPRYYNFTTDKLVTQVRIDLDALKLWVLIDKARTDGFGRYLREKYTSRDGFISFVDNSVDAFFGEDGSFGQYPDVLIDYYVLTQIYGTTDIVGVAEKGETRQTYHWEIYEGADEIFYMHMKPVGETA